MRYFTTVEDEDGVLNVRVLERDDSGEIRTVALLTSLPGSAGLAAVYEISRLAAMGAFGSAAKLAHSA